MTTGSRHERDPVLFAVHAAFVPALGGAVLDLLAPKPGERILDIGCGDGVLTGDAGNLVADHVRIRFLASLPE